MASSALHQPQETFEGKTETFASQKFLDAVEREDETQAQALIFVIKVGEWVEAFGAEVETSLLPLLVRQLCQATPQTIFGALLAVNAQNMALIGKDFT